jgi:hypothetical protein
MFHDKRGPIERFSWGMFVIGGKEHGKISGEKRGKGKDIRLIGTRVSKWKEREGHLLTPAMITGVFDEGVEVLVIGTGVEGLVECPEEVLKSIRKRGIQHIVLEKTPDACRCYNDLFHEGKGVALLAHGTC